MSQSSAFLSGLISQFQNQLLDDWINTQQHLNLSDTRLRQEQLDHSKRFLEELRKGLQSGGDGNIKAASWTGVRQILEEVSRTRTAHGLSASQTATFLFSLKEPLIKLLFKELKNDTDKLQQEIWTANSLMDRLGLYITELAQNAREEVISRQQQELLELSTPVVELWKGILALPLIGTLDSGRTQIVMENLLERIVSTGASIAIIDITGVPTVDTLVAQHLIKTVSAARLMGADCIISGIRAQIAQTIVHLGLELNVVSKASMADAFALALRRTGRYVENRPTTAGE